MQIKNIAIIGAGVIGSTCAVKLVENLGNEISITIFSDDFSPNTTGDVSAGLWGPFLLSQTPEDQIIKWSKATHEYFHYVWKSGNAVKAGISLISSIRVTKSNDADSLFFWTDIVFGARKLTNQQLNELNHKQKTNFRSGVSFTTFTCEPNYFLPFLYEKIKDFGGKIVQRKIESLDELDTFDLIINCSGLGAKGLLNDTEMKPIRGQVIRVRAPWQLHVFLDDSDDGNYIIPNIDAVILGGTHQENDYNVLVDQKDHKFIYDGCLTAYPALKNAKILKESVGLRPGRTQVRLEHEVLRSKNGKWMHVIHNYGHGGSGVTLSWGCAIDVYNIVLNLIHRNDVRSKL